jgi:hypothetical protein
MSGTPSGAASEYPAIERGLQLLRLRLHQRGSLPANAEPPFKESNADVYSAPNELSSTVIHQQLCATIGSEEVPPAERAGKLSNECAAIASEPALHANLMGVSATTEVGTSAVVVNPWCSPPPSRIPRPRSAIRSSGGVLPEPVNTISPATSFSRSTTELHAIRSRIASMRIAQQRAPESTSDEADVPQSLQDNIPTIGTQSAAILPLASEDSLQIVATANNEKSASTTQENTPTATTQSETPSVPTSRKPSISYYARPSEYPQGLPLCRAKPPARSNAPWEGKTHHQCLYFTLLHLQWHAIMCSLVCRQGRR